MIINKTNRVRSAVQLRGHTPSIQKTSLINIKTLQKDPESISNIGFDQIKQLSNENNKSKENQFRLTLKRLPTSNSNKSLITKTGFIEYNSQSWRTVNSARSLTRLQSLKKFKQKDPIKVNLQQKVLRIKSKHKEQQSQCSARTQQLFDNNENRYKQQKVNDSNIISKKINQILIKWQKEKFHSIQVYRKKIQLLAQQSQNRFSTKKIKLIKPQIKWQIC